MMFERDVIEHAGEQIVFETRRIERRKTLSIEVHPDLRVVVRSPAGCDADTIREKIHKRAVWIKRQLRYFEQFQPRTPHRQYLSGETHLYLGRRYVLKVRLANCESVKVAGGTLLVTGRGRSSAVVRATLDEWFRQRAKQAFARYLPAAMAKAGLSAEAPPRISVRSMTTRWGSMSEGGLLTLNPRLVHAAPACIEYVLVHELCHLRVKNHGKEFQRTLSRALPDWQKRKARLESLYL